MAAPFVGLVYYLALLNAFRTAIGDVVADSSDLQAAVADGVHLWWGAHWIYHSFAEVVSIAFGTFVAGGLARERAAVAALIGGFGISLWWTAWLAIIVFLFFVDPTSEAGEPRYEYVIAAIAGISAPIIGFTLGEGIKGISTEVPSGFAGIPRAHFLWLWFPAYWYAAAMIGPFLNFYFSQLLLDDFFSRFKLLYLSIIYLVPFLAFAFPLYVGLLLISGHIPLPTRNHSSRMRPFVPQALGTITLIAGWVAAAAIQYGIIQFLNWL